MNDEEKRQKKNEYQRKWRAKKAESIISKPILEVNLDDAVPLKYKPKKAKKIDLKDNTIATYTTKLRAFHKRMTGLPLSENIINAIEGKEYDKKAIQDEFKYIYERLEYIKVNEVSAIPNICKIFSKFVGFAKLIKVITPMKWKVEEALQNRRNESTIKEEDLISFDKEEVLQNALKLTGDYEKIMYLIMMLIPTRRFDDYRSMTYGVSDANYFDDEHMYIREKFTKNKKSIVIKIPTEIIDIIPKSGYLFGKAYTASALSVKFSNLMNTIYGKKIGALDVRRMYLTTINQSGASYNERQKIAEAVGHSTDESLRYSLKVQALPQQVQVQDVH